VSLQRQSSASVPWKIEQAVPMIEPFGHGSPQSHDDCRQVAQQPAMAAASAVDSRAIRALDA
jgi:hypothetical protein